MHPIVSKRSAFAACIMTIAGIAATPGRAIADDAGAAGDAGLAALDASPDVAVDAPSSAPDATLGAVDAAAAVDAATPGEGPVMDDGSLPTFSGNVFQQLCVDDPSVADPTARPMAFTSVVAPYATPDACKAFDAQGHAGAHSCYCDKCFSIIQQCDALAGCREILKCELDANCGDPSTCYFGKCAKVIDKWANTSAASFLTYLLEQCNTANACPKQ